ncbi:unnamed protein product, partial [Effrenium voratum]
KLSHVPARKSVNVWSIFWENTKPDIQPHVHARFDCYAVSFLVVDDSVGALPCTEWLTNSLLPQWSLQVLAKQHPGALQGVPFLCVGDIVRGHRMTAERKQPRYLNIWHRRYTSVSFSDTDGREIEPNHLECVFFEEHEATITEEDRHSMRHLFEWIRGVLKNQTLSAYLKTIASLNFQDSEDVIVEALPGALVAAVLPPFVLATDFQRKEMLITDWSTEPRILCAPLPSLKAAWLFQKLQPGHWVKIRAVTNRPLQATNAALPDPEEEAEESDNRGAALAADLFARSSQVTRVPEWCKDVVVRNASRAIDDNLQARISAFNLRAGDSDRPVPRLRPAPRPALEDQADELQRAAAGQPASSRPGRTSEAFRAVDAPPARLDSKFYDGEAPLEKIEAALSPQEPRPTCCWAASSCVASAAPGRRAARWSGAARCRTFYWQCAATAATATPRRTCAAWNRPGFGGGLR